MALIKHWNRGVPKLSPVVLFLARLSYFTDLVKMTHLHTKENFNDAAFFILFWDLGFASSIWIVTGLVILPLYTAVMDLKWSAQDVIDVRFHL